MMQLINYTIVFLFFLFVLLVRSIEKSFWTPAALFSLLYFLLTLFAPISKYTSFWGIFTIYSFVLSFVVGNIIASFSVKKGNKEAFFVNIHGQTLLVVKAIYLSCVLSALIGLFILIKALNVDFLNLFSLKGFIRISHRSSMLRYKEGFQTPFLSNVLFSFGYFACFLSGFFYPELRKSSILIFVIFLAYALIYTTKASFLLPLIFAFSSSLLRKFIQTDRVKLNFKLTFFIFVMVIILTVFTSFLRYNGRMDKRTLKHISVYFIGNITPFTYWISEKYNIFSNVTFGQYTFKGLFALMGLEKRKAGVYRDYIPILDGEESNIHTVFRGLIEDFSLPGVYLILSFLGFLSKLLLIKLRRGNFLAAGFLLPIYSFILWSPVYSIMAYNSLILAHFLLIPFFFYLHKKKNMILCKKDNLKCLVVK